MNFVGSRQPNYKKMDENSITILHALNCYMHQMSIETFQKLLKLIVNTETRLSGLIETHIGAYKTTLVILK